MRVCACLSLSVCECVCARVCQRERRRLWLILQQKPLRGEMEQTKQRQDGGKVPAASLIGSVLLTCVHTYADPDAYTHVQPLHSPLPSRAHAKENRGEVEDMLPPRHHPSSATMACSMCSRLVWSLKRNCLQECKKRKDRAWPKHTGKSILSACGLLFWVTWMRKTGGKRRRCGLSLYWASVQMHISFIHSASHFSFIQFQKYTKVKPSWEWQRGGLWRIVLGVSGSGRH